MRLFLQYLETSKKIKKVVVPSILRHSMFIETYKHFNLDPKWWMNRNNHYIGRIRNYKHEK